jgi:hypothetical protein
MNRRDREELTRLREIARDAIRLTNDGMTVGRWYDLALRCRNHVNWLENQATQESRETSYWVVKRVDLYLVGWRGECIWSPLQIAAARFDRKEDAAGSVDPLTRARPVRIVRKEKR